MKLRIFNLLLVIVISISMHCYGQNKKIDSLLTLLKTDLVDTNKVNRLCNVSNEYRKLGEIDKALTLGEQALTLALKLDFRTGSALAYNNLALIYKNQDNYPKSLVYYLKGLKISEIQDDKKLYTNALSNIGDIYSNQSDFPTALEYYFKALKINEELRNKSGVAFLLNNIGNVYNYQGDYPKALDYYFKTLRIDEELNDKNGIATDFCNIGVVYNQQNDYKKALEYYFKALKIDEEIGNKKNIALLLSNIGNVYNDQNNNPKALDYYLRALKIAEELDDKKRQAVVYHNIGNVYDDQNNNSKAFGYYFKALKINEEIGRKNKIAGNLGSIGVLFTKEKKYRDAYHYLYRALAISDSIKAMDDVKDWYERLSSLYENSNIPLPDSIGKKTLTMEQMRLRALYYHKRYISLKDTLFSEENRKEIVRKEMNFEFEKKEIASKAEQEKLAEINLKEKQKQHSILILVSFILLLVAAFSVFLYHRVKVTQKQRYIIQLQRDEVSRQKILIEEKQSKIVDSINYARYIQQSILADEDKIRECIKDFFVLYLPKDIVSGDFYWFTKQGSELFFACVDCTGHGVPGAFLSMVGSTLLNEIVDFKKITDPYAIIKNLGEELKNTFSNKRNKNQVFADGMDISICKINIETRKLYFASANHSVFVVDNNGLTQLNPQIKSVHGVFATSVQKEISTTEVLLNPGAMIYMTTDGYTDQVAEQSKRKLMMPRLKEILMQLNKLPVGGQKVALEKIHMEWKGNRRQNDDILIMGFRIPE
ncbi:MAG TPA: tetratricopeptide repeat protein [Bacteroidia bacterium]|jgi:tetratricopeptide (TPR) repeat protein|nr:tetratricopeptide repeat protein [Bacteroidia bacterium]